MAVPFGDAKVTIRQGGEVIWQGTLDDISSAPTCSPSRNWVISKEIIKEFGPNRDKPIPVGKDSVFAPRKVEVEC